MYKVYEYRHHLLLWIYVLTHIGIRLASMYVSIDCLQSVLTVISICKYCHFLFSIREVGRETRVLAMHEYVCTILATYVCTNQVRPHDKKGALKYRLYFECKINNHAAHHIHRSRYILNTHKHMYIQVCISMYVSMHTASTYVCMHTRM